MCKQSCPFKALKACLAPQVNAKCTQHCGKHKQANNGNMQSAINSLQPCIACFPPSRFFYVTFIVSFACIKYYLFLNLNGYIIIHKLKVHTHTHIAILVYKYSFAHYHRIKKRCSCCWFCC